MKPSGEVIFGEKAIQETWSARQGINEESTRQGGTPTPWARPPPSWAPRGSPDVFLPPIYISIYPKTIGEHNRSGVPPSQASVATKNQSGPYSGTLPEGDPSPVAMCLRRRE